MPCVATTTNQATSPLPPRVTAAEAHASAATEQGQQVPCEWAEWIYRGAVGLFSVMMLVVSVSAFHLTLAEHQVPDLLITVGAGAIGTLAGLVALSPRR
jgi:hypothetical protein